MIRTLLPLLVLLGACQTAPQSRVSRADRDACRARADAIYQQQHRADLSVRDTRDSPFATSGLPGITSAGLSSLFARDDLVADCTNGAQPIDAGTGPTFAGPKSR